MNLTILAQIASLAYVGALDSQALSAVCAMHRGTDATLTATVRAAHAATEAAVAVALDRFGVKPHDTVPGSASSFESNGRTYAYSTDYITGARVHGTALIRGL